MRLVDCEAVGLVELAGDGTVDKDNDCSNELPVSEMLVFGVELHPSPTHDGAGMLEPRQRESVHVVLRAEEALRLAGRTVDGMDEVIRDDENAYVFIVLVTVT